MENGQQSNIPLNDRFFALLCYIMGGLLFSIIIYFVKKDSQFLRFYALQSIYFNIFALLLTVPSFALSLFTLPRFREIIEKDPLLLSIFLLVAIMSFLFTLYNISIALASYQGEVKKIPLIGSIVYNKIFN